MKYTPKVHSKLAKDFDESPTLKQLLSVALNNKTVSKKSNQPTASKANHGKENSILVKEQLKEVKEYRSDLETIAKKVEKLQKYFKSTNID